MNDNRIEGNTHFIKWDARDSKQNADIIAKHMSKTKLVLGFPPCTDLAVSGAQWFARKRAANPNFQKEALDMVFLVKEIADALKAPYAIENPVGVISTMWRKPDFKFHPWEYGGYIPESEAAHPLYPKYIMPRDAYPKNTCYWIGNGFKIPEKKPVKQLQTSTQKNNSTGSSTPKKIKSISPRGMAIAIYRANK